MRSRNEWRAARVAKVEQVADDVRAITFAVEGALPAFDPGSHMNIKVMIGGLAANRTYTCIPSPKGTLRIAVKLHENSRGGSRYIWSLEEGQEVSVTVPENRFELSWRAPYYLLMAGGIGVTPIYGMAKALKAHGADFRVVYGARDRGLMAFVDEMETELGERLETFSQAEGRHIDIAGEIAALPDDAEVYVCGPIGMLNAIKAAWAEAGRPVSRLRYEVFGDSGLFAEETFEVIVAGRDVSVIVPPDQTMLEALMNAGVDMVYDCQRGECGLCAVTVLDHEKDIDHRDVFFSEEEKKENHRMCACVSRLNGGRATIDVGYRT